MKRNITYSRVGGQTIEDYIERGAFIEVVKDIPMWGSVAVMLADSIPAADVAPVVRCKHCTDGIMSNDNKYIICCRLGVGMEFDDFCSHVERKDEGIG